MNYQENRDRIVKEIAKVKSETMLPMKILPKPEEMVRFDREYMEGYFQALGAVRELISREITLQELYEALIDCRQMIYDRKCRIAGEKSGLLWQ